ncbi:MAG: transglutaminase-like domain-containing protein [Bacteroidales bacterium]|nr:transglutaminase-like domain-containing protein [Bacteroidales bacterium]
MRPSRIAIVLVIIIPLISCNFSDFRRMITGYSAYCKILKKYSNYDSSKLSNDIQFLYNTNDSLIKQLKSYPNFPQDFDSLSEIDKIIKLKTWINETLSYEYGYSGEKGKILCKPRNLIGMLEKRDDLNTIFVCRDLGIALAELYLSVGLKARYITCMSSFTKDRDSHVVTEVFWNEKNKWIMMEKY